MSDYWKKKMDELNNGKKSSSTSNYWQNKLTELEKEKKKKKEEADDIPIRTDIAPKKTSTNYLDYLDPSHFDTPHAYAGAVVGNWISDLIRGDNDDERTWFQKGALEDGATFENWMKGSVATTADAKTDLGAGALGLVEGTIDSAAAIAPMVEAQNIRGNYTDPGAQAGATLGKMLASWIMGKDANYVQDQLDERAQQTYNQMKTDLTPFIQKELIDEQAVSKWLVDHTTVEGIYTNAKGIDVEKASFFGDKTDSLVQSGGQLAAQIGLSYAGVPWWLTSGVSAYGGEVENALNQGATLEEANVSGLISAGAEILTEKISGGVKLPGMGGTLDDILTRHLATGISDKFARTLAKMGIDVFGEGLEEALTNDISAFGQWLTYRDEEELKDLLFSEEAMEAKIEAFIGGAVLGGMGSASQVYQATKAGKDYTTGLTEDEFKVVNKAYDKLVEQEGGKVSPGKRNELWAKANQYMDDGRITAGYIESVLGGEAYEKYKAEVDAFKATDDYKALKQAESDRASLPELEKRYTELFNMKRGDMTGKQMQEEAELKKKLEEIANSTTIKDLQAKLAPEATRLASMQEALRGEVFSRVKDSRLAESYRELARSKQKLDMDATKYANKNARQVVQAVVDSGLMDNTNQSKRTVEFLAKLAADKNLSVEALSNEAINKAKKVPNGYTIHGFITKDGKMTLNMESPRLLQTTAGHEITHIFEGTELYNALSQVAKDFCIAKEGLDGYNKRITEAESVYGGDENTTPEGEVVADIIGQYLFADEDFVNSLSANKDVFDKVYSEVKYLCKIAVAGSNEQRQLEKLKRAFDRVYQQTVEFDGNADGKAQNSIRRDIVDVNGTEYDSVVELDREVSDSVLSSPKRMMNWIKDNLVGFRLPVLDENGNTEIIEFAGEKEVTYKDRGEGKGASRNPVLGELAYTKGDIRKRVVVNLLETINESVDNPRGYSSNNEHGWLDENGWISRKTYVLASDGKIYEAFLRIAKARDGRKILYGVNLDAEKGIAVDESATQKRAAVIAAMPSAGTVAQKKPSVKGQNSISKDIGNTGKMLYTGSSVVDIEQFKVGGANGAKQTGDRYGRGIYLTTNESTAKGYAGDKGRVYKINADDLNIFDLNESITEDMKATLARELNGKDKQFRNSILRSFRTEKEFADFDSAERFFDEQREVWKAEDGYYSANKPEIKSADNNTGRAVIEYTDFTNIDNAIGRMTGNDLYDALKSISTDDFASFITGHGFDGIAFDEDSSNQQYVIYRNEDRLNILNDEDIAPTKYSVSKDTTGKELTLEQSDFFKDSKAVNELGELVRVYHGTRKADFTVFKRNATYFTDNKDMADSYSPNGDMYEGYVNITNPFEIDAQGEKWSKIPIDDETREFLERYGSSVFEEDGEWRTSPADLVAAIEEAIEEGEVDYDGIIIRNVDDTGSYYKDKDSHLATDYITFNSNQFKNVDNIKPTKDPDIRFSMSKEEKAKMDNDYMAAVANNDDDTLNHLVREYAKQSMPETKLLDENGNPRIVYHGTNTGDFTVFNPDYIGMSSGDDGFFGMGFYFAYSKGEASYYGASRVIPAYLDLKNPFNFDKEFRTYNGKKAMSGHAPDAVALMNFADKFPDIAMSITLDVAKEYGKVESISLFEFSKEFKNVIENKYFEVEETVNDYGEKETIVTADPQTHSYEYNGETHTYRDFGFQKRWYGTPNEYDVAYEYLSNSVYSYIDMPRLTSIILDNNREFTAELKNRGYDGTIQSEYGDEAVVFDPSQIKSAEPITYDDNGEVIPLSKRFDRSNDDIRYSMSKVDEHVNAYEYNLKNGDLLGAEMAVEEIANLAMPDSKIRGEDGRLIPVYHGTKEMFYEFDPTIGGGKNGTAEGFGIYLSDDQEVTNAYGDRQIKMFANITKPATSFDKTIKSGTLVKLIKDTCERQAQQMVEEEGYDSLEDALRDTWISNYVMTYEMSIEQAYRTVANDILKTQTNDKDIIHEVMFGMAIRDYATAMNFYRNSLTPVTGFDGFVTKWENNGKTSNIYMAFDSSQLKMADAVTKDDNGNIIPITERFDFGKKDIRYSVSKDGDEDIPFGYKSAKELAYNKESDIDIPIMDDIAPVAENTNVTAPVTNVGESSVPEEDMLPDETASLRGELSSALAEKAELEERLEEATKNLARAGATEQDLRAFEEVSNAYDALMTRISELEQKVNSDTFTDYTDADAPMETERFGDSLPDATEIGKGDIANIANEAGKTLSLNSKQKAEFRKLIEDYSNSENPSREQLFDAIKEKFGAYTERVFEKTISEAKKYLRTTKLYLSDTIVGDIADFADFKYRNRGKVILSQNGGLEVDVAYKELQSYWPNLFPESIINPTDQLLKMVDVAGTSSTTRIDTPIDEKTLWEVANDVADSVEETKRLQQEADRNKLASDAFDSLMQEANANEQATSGTENKVDDSSVSSVSKKLEARIRNTQAELDKNREYREKALKDFDDEIAKLQSEYDAKKNKTVRSANDLLRRIERLRRLRNNTDADYANRISRLEARMEKLNNPDYRTSEHRRSKMQEHTDFWEATLGDTSTWKDMALGLAYKTKTLRRILRTVVRDANGKPDIAKADEIYDALETKYDHNEAQLKKESVKLKEVFKELKLNHTEDTYAHMLGEFRHNPQTTLTEEVVNEYYEKHKNKINTEKVERAITEARKTFDDLIVRVNAVLKEQGMKEIPYRKGYFPHFTNPKQGWLAKLLNWKTIDTEIPTSIAGLTEQFDPQRSWQGFNKQRQGDKTDYSLYQGLDTYIHGALDWIYHIDDLQSRRALENYIRYVHSEEGVKAKIDEIKANEYLDADATQVAIDAVLAEAKNPLNNLVTELRARTNTLANKKASMDRGMEEATNRKIYSTMTNLNNRINANMVVGSVSSALTNFIPMVQSWHQVSPVFTVRGLGDFIRSTVHDDGMVAKSDYLTNRLVEEEKLYQTGWDKVSDKAAWLMNTIDNITSQTVWRSKYLQNLKEGMSESAAIKDADQFAKNLMAGRSRGNAPTIFDAKNPIIKIATAFQLEVANQYGFMFEDTPQDVKNKARLVKGYATAFLGAYMYNALYSSLVGRDAAFDPISIIEDLFGDLFDDDDDDEDDVQDALLGLGENILQEVPFVGGLLGGGRVPMSSALPYSSDSTPFESMLNDVTEGNWDSFGKELLKPLYYLAMPVGGGQLKKTVEGLAMFDDDLPVSGSYTDSGKLRFPVEKTVGNVAQAAVFGQYASKNAREYFDEGYAPLSEKQIQEYIDLDIPIRDYREYRAGLKGKDSAGEKLAYIDSLDLPIRKQNILANNVVDRKEPIDMADWDKYDGLEEYDYAKKYPEKHQFLEANGISVKQYNSFDDDTKDAWSWAYKNPGKYAMSKAVTSDLMEYRQYSNDLGEIRADKDSNGNSISGSAKQKKLDYINSLNIDYGAKLILYKSQYKSDDLYNYEIVEYLNSIDEFSYEDRIDILEELGFTIVGDGTVQWD